MELTQLFALCDRSTTLAPLGTFHTGHTVFAVNDYINENSSLHNRTVVTGTQQRPPQLADLNAFDLSGLRTLTSGVAQQLVIFALVGNSEAGKTLVGGFMSERLEAQGAKCCAFTGWRYELSSSSLGWGTGISFTPVIARSCTVITSRFQRSPVTISPGSGMRPKRSSA